MTTEEKAKAHDEALERAKKLLLGNEHSNTIRSYFEHIFPELRESEDEMIRRTLVEYFGPEVQLDFVRGVPIQKIRDWLEKQKESLHITESRKENADSFTSEDERIRKELVALFIEVRNREGNEGYWHDLKVADILAYLEKQEQKPVEWNDTDMKEARDNLISVCRDWERGEQTTLLPIIAVRARYFLEHLTEPKSAEWSEFDKGALKDAICAADILGNDESFNKGNPCLAKAFRVAKDWLKSLPERFDLQPKQEWSEEDEEMLNSIIATCKLVQEERDSSPARHLFKKQERWLKTHYSNEKSEKPMYLEEEINRYLREECSDDDEPGIHEIAEHFAEWGYLRAAEKYNEIEYNRQRAEENEKPSAKDAMKELNEKIALVKQRGTWDGVDVDKYMDEVRGREPENPMEKEVNPYHRTRKKLAEWSKTPEGRESYEKVAEEMRKQIVPNDLEEAANEFANQDCVTFISRKNGFIAGAKWQREQDTRDMLMSDNRNLIKCYEQGKKDMKEQMMKEAVEGEVWNYASDEDLRAIPIWGIDKFRHLKDGDKVRMVIVKED